MVWRCAAARSCGLICRSVVQPACFLVVSTLTTTPLLRRELSALATGAAMTGPTAIGIEIAHARRRHVFLAVIALQSLADVRCEIRRHGSQPLPPRPASR